MAEQVSAARVRAGKKGAKVANRWRAGDRAKASRASRKIAKKIPTATRKRAAKKAAKTRKARGKTTSAKTRSKAR